MRLHYRILEGFNNKDSSSMFLCLPVTHNEAITLDAVEFQALFSSCRNEDEKINMAESLHKAIIRSIHSGQRKGVITI